MKAFAWVMVYLVWASVVGCLYTATWGSEADAGHWVTTALVQAIIATACTLGAALREWDR